MRELKPCSKVFDNEPHDAHTYYHAGHDVRCLGYSPIRTVSSDDAETPEEFFGLDPITKAPKEIADCVRRVLADNHKAHDWRFDGRQVHCYGYDSKIERLLSEEEEIQLEELKAELEMVLDEEKARLEFDYAHGNVATRAVLWYEDLRPIKKDLVMLVIASITFSILFIVIQTLFN